MKRHADILEAIILNDSEIAELYLSKRKYYIPYLAMLFGIIITFMIFTKKGR